VQIIQVESILHGEVSRLAAVLRRKVDVLYVAWLVSKPALHLLLNLWILRT
jgi:hypothetical protein